MERPLFSDMLLDRRRQLGLSIKQASNVLRLKEEVLVAFEEGDFDSIPKSGYAQGMLSSYARYLGLNAKTIVNQFSQDLFEHERGSGSHEARRRSRLTRESDDGPLYETPQANTVGQGRSNRTYVESHGFLPTSGGFAGDMGDFATTSDPRPRYGASSRYDEAGEAYPQGRPYTSRVPVSTATTLTPLVQTQRQRSSSRSGGYGSSYGQDQYGRSSRRSSSRYGMRDEVTTRRVMPSQYRDDMRLDNEGGTYEAASSSEGRRSSRNIASTQRPNVRRRGTASSRNQVRNRERSPQNSGGLVGQLVSFFQDGSQATILVAVLVGAIIFGIVLFFARSCINAQQSTGRTVPVTSVAEETSEEKDSSSEMTDEEEKRAREEAAAAKAAESETSASERVIEVSVQDGEVTWLEIEYDGSSDIAETVTGPWNRTYTVRQAISINVNDTSAVTVTENGKKLEFDSKASGIGTITIQVSKATDASVTDTSSGQSQDQTQGTEATGDATQQGTQAPTANQPVDNSAYQQQAPQQPQQQYYETPQQQYGQNTEYSQPQQQQQGATSYEGYTLDEDGYYYGADGYYDAYGNFYSY